VSHDATRTARINNSLGVHLRAAGAIVQVANRFVAEVWIEYRGHRANAKSIMSVLTLAAAKGAEVSIHADGEDAAAAVDALVALIADDFGLP
jgi:phosphocarrier protein